VLVFSVKALPLKFLFQIGLMLPVASFFQTAWPLLSLVINQAKGKCGFQIE